MHDVLSLINEALAGRYRLLNEIGRGGMATVYLADDPKHGRQVAIKVLNPETALSLGTERFLREIGIAARLSHPHIVPLIDSGAVQAGTGDASEPLFFYVSQFVPGGSLRERLKRERRLPLRDALRITTEIGAALDYAHGLGVVHRDVKPENILFAGHEGGGGSTNWYAVLTDFGVARAARAREGEFLTEAGLTLGTPDYMSPEQAAADPNIEPVSDVYSLACVLYEMLTGEPPFYSGSAGQTIARHLTEVARPVRAVSPATPPGVEKALQRALAKKPSERFARASDFIAALHEESAAGERRPARTRAVAVLPFVNASPDAENEYLSDGITDELIDALSKVRGLRVSSRTSVFALKGKPQDVRALGALLGVSEVLEGTVRKSGDRVRVTAQLTCTSDGRLLWSQRFDRTFDDVFAIQDEIAHTIVQTLRTGSFAELAEPGTRNYAQNPRAYTLYLRGRYEWNKRTHEGVAAGIRHFEDAIREDPSYAPAYTGLADSYALQVDYRSVPVHEGLEKAEAYARKALALDESLAEAHASLAWSLFIYGWKWDEAGREFRRAIELAPSYASAHQWYAFLLSSHARHDEALLAGHTALELDPASVSIRRGLGWLYFYARRYDQAQYHLDRAIAMNPEAEESYRVLGITLFHAGRIADAERVLRDALTLPAAGSYARAALGYVLARSGQRDEAEQLLRDLDAAAVTGYVSPVAFATLYLGLEDWDLAMEWIERAEQERRGWLVYVRVNPVFDPVRDDPRFGRLAARLGL